MDPVVGRPVNANPGFKFNLGSRFSYPKNKKNSKWSFKSNRSQNVGHKIFTGILSSGYKTKFKIDANPG